jgi:hypothetical protein
MGLLTIKKEKKNSKRKKFNSLKKKELAFQIGVSVVLVPLPIEQNGAFWI